MTTYTVCLEGYLPELWADEVESRVFLLVPLYPLEHQALLSHNDHPLPYCVLNEIQGNSDILNSCLYPHSTKLNRISYTREQTLGDISMAMIITNIHKFNIKVLRPLYKHFHIRS